MDRYQTRTMRKLTMREKAIESLAFLLFSVVVIMDDLTLILIGMVVILFSLGYLLWTTRE